MLSWHKSLLQALQCLKIKDNKTPRIAVLGIGSELNADDAAGVLIARRLVSRYEEDDSKLILDCGTVPENFSGALRKFHPDYVLIIDAGDFGAEPGTISFADWHNTDGMGFSTHSLPPSVFAEYLISELGCQLGLLLIQAKNIEFCEEISPEILQAVDTVSALAI